MLGESQGALMEASDGAAASRGQDCAYVYPFKVVYKVLCLWTPFHHTRFTYRFSQMSTDWTTAAFCPNHTMALQISSESTGCE